MKSKFIPTVAVVLAFGMGIVMHVSTSRADVPATIKASNPSVITMEPRTEPLPTTTEPTPASGSNSVKPSTPGVVRTSAQVAPTDAPTPAIVPVATSTPKPSPTPFVPQAKRVIMAP